MSVADQVGNSKTKSRAQPEASEFVKDEYLLEQLEHYEYQNQNSCSVKGRLRAHLQFWKDMCAYDNINLLGIEWIPKSQNLLTI